MKNVAIVVVGLVLTAAAARADEVRLSGLSYTNVTVTGVADGQIKFRTAAAEPTKPLGKVSLVQITGRGRFNRAEELAAAGKFADAIYIYDELADASSGWFKDLVALRRLAALNAAGMIDRATRQWLALGEQTKAAPWAMSLRPTKLAKAGSKENDEAIRLIKAALDKKPNESLANEAQQLLLALYQAQKRSGEAQKLATTMVGSDEEEASAVAPNRLDAQLQAARALLAQGQAQQALDSIQSSLNEYPPSQLSEAMLLAGKARLALAKSAVADVRAELTVQAGLDLMRVVAYYPASAEAPEAMYLAGQVNERFDPPNSNAAARAYQQVLQLYGDSEFAAKAAKALAALRK